MDATTFQIIGSIIVALIGGGGVAAYRKQRHTHANGLPDDEGEARQVAPAADWLTRQVDSLLAASREEMQELRKRQDAQDKRIAFQERERELDAEHIDALEQHIWLQLPPPPPARTRLQRRDAE